MSLPVISISGLKKQFAVGGKHKQFTAAVDGIDLKVAKGEIYGIIGPDGAGKTTFLRLIIGALLPDAGSILVEGISSIEEPEKVREKIGYMPQAYGLYSDLSVYENMQFFGNLFGKTSKTEIMKILEFIKLDNFKDRKAGVLSGGMYKKLAIGVAILHSPGILILDEPTNGVDPVSRRDLWALLFSLAEKGVSVLVSTPYMDEAERCHRVGLFVKGKKIKEGEPKVMINSIHNQLYSFITNDNTSAIRMLRKKFPNYTFYSYGKEIRLFAAKIGEALVKLLITGLEKEKYKVESHGKSVVTFEDVFMMSMRR